LATTITVETYTGSQRHDMGAPGTVPAWIPGATSLGAGLCEFLVWAPFTTDLTICLLDKKERIIVPDRTPDGYYHASVDSVEPGVNYWYVANGTRRPDPASRYQPQGVHGPSRIVSRDFPWEDAGWSGLELADYIFYELHVGTFSKSGTLDGVIAHLPELKALGITAIELMPVAQFPGNRNWGYDGVYPYAVQDSYGGPAALKRLVNACHLQGLAVTLDVVYNHLGPEGNYLANFGPYFTNRYKTPWGQALNFDGSDSDAVRHFFVQNALYWITEFHIDSLRVDAVHAVADQSAHPFLAELNAAVSERAALLKRPVPVIAESNLNDVRVINCSRPYDLGFSAQWSDDFHHSLHTLLTGEEQGYYQDFGQLSHLAKAYAEGFVYTGQHSAFHRRKHGNSSREVAPCRLVVCSQNHDQAGNRMLGERLSSLTGFDGMKLAAAAVLLSPYLPLLFMGEEYGETAPFLYCTNHSDPDLIEAVRRGRKQEYAAFSWKGEAPDPQAEATFLQSKLRPDQRDERGNVLYNFYRELIRLRRTSPALAHPAKEAMEVIALDEEQTLFVRRWSEEHQACLAFHFSPVAASLKLPVPRGYWRIALDSDSAQWLGTGRLSMDSVVSPGEVELTLSPKSAVMFDLISDS
jgi:maltooligosyltrehalose trehalohydrolase